MSGPWPATRQWLDDNGYQLEARRRCAGRTCRTTIEFWRTPAGRLMPLNIVGNDTQFLQPHWETCVDQQQFRSKPQQERIPKLKRQQEAVKKRAEKIESGRLF